MNKKEIGMVEIEKIRRGDVLISRAGVYGAVELIDRENALIGLKTREGIRPFRPGELKTLRSYLAIPKRGEEIKKWKGFALFLLESFPRTPGMEEILKELKVEGINMVPPQEILEF